MQRSTAAPSTAALALALVLSSSTTACLRLKTSNTGASATAATPTKYMDTKDRLEPLDVQEEASPSASFVLEGKPFCFAGSNNYYVTFKNQKMIDDVFNAAKAMDLKVLRVWGYEDRGSLDGSVKSLDGNGTKEDVFFQYWDPVEKRAKINDDPKNGLARLDAVIAKARTMGIKIIVVLTNNWHDFGGMDQYLQWYGLKKHHEFYTDPRVKQTYKDYAKALVNRKNSVDGTLYRDDPAIFAWELANEPRCKNYTEFDAPGWDKSMLTQWADEMSGYIKSIDSNHLIAVGDEGGFGGGGYTQGGPSGDGVDHEALLALEHVDFGTFHLYPEDWSTGLRWSYRFIEDNLTVARKLGKPTVLEEYGIKVRRDAAGQISGGWDKRALAYKNWNELLLKHGGAGSMFWMLAGINEKGVNYEDYDHFTVYRDDASAKLLAPFTQRFATNAQACKRTLPADTPVSPFVQTTRPTGGAARPAAVAFAGAP